MNLKIEDVSLVSKNKIVLVNNIYAMEQGDLEPLKSDGQTDARTQARESISIVSLFHGRENNLSKSSPSTLSKIIPFRACIFSWMTNFHINITFR